MSQSDTQPAFVAALHHAYNVRRKSVSLLTGNTKDVFWSEQADAFLPIDRALYERLSDRMLFIRFDLANGIGLFNDDDEELFLNLCQAWNQVHGKDEHSLGDVSKMIEELRNRSLASLNLLIGVSDVFHTMDRVNRKFRNQAKTEPYPGVRPLCVVMPFANALFPAGELGSLHELKAQRLVTFLNWIQRPDFAKTNNLVVLISDTRAEINSLILEQSCSTHIEVELPQEPQRQWMVDRMLTGCKNPPIFEPSRDAFVGDTIGLRLTDMADLLEGGMNAGHITRTDVLREKNKLLKAKLDGIVKVHLPEHGVDDLIGYLDHRKAFERLFKRCENPDTAVPVVIISGPNGAGKTYQLEAYAKASGRIVIVLTGLRSRDFGGTDKLFEMLHWTVLNLGNVAIFVDEAHTKFGSIHSSDTHQTEARLVGNIINMMADPRFLGKVVWMLMTTRPDLLDPDIISRAPVQIPVFDLPVGSPERRDFVHMLFAAKQVEIDDAELERVLEKTMHYSNRDYRNLRGEVLDYAGDMSVSEVLEIYDSGKAIINKRRLQSLIASQHCTYSKLVPEELRTMNDHDVVSEIERLKHVVRA